MWNPDKTKFYTMPAADAFCAPPIWVEMAGFEYCSPTYHIERSCSYVNVLCYCLAGEGRVHSDGDSYTVGAGEIMILEKGSTHEYYANRRNPWILLWFNILGGLFPSLLTFYGLSGKIFHNSVPEAALGLFQEGLSLCDAPFHPQTQHLLTRLFLQIVQSLSDESEREKDSLSPRCRQIRRYIDNQLKAQPSAGLSLSEMASALRLSVRQLTRSFQLELHCSPYAYHLHRKLSLACQYLQGTSMTIKDISQTLGFCDPYYFSNQFKLKKGLSPSEYRRVSS